MSPCSSKHNWRTNPYKMIIGLAIRWISPFKSSTTSRGMTSRCRKIRASEWSITPYSIVRMPSKRMPLSSTPTTSRMKAWLWAGNNAVLACSRAKASATRAFQPMCRCITSPTSWASSRRRIRKCRWNHKLKKEAYSPPFSSRTRRFNKISPLRIMVFNQISSTMKWPSSLPWTRPITK